MNSWLPPLFAFVHCNSYTFTKQNFSVTFWRYRFTEYWILDRCALYSVARPSTWSFLWFYPFYISLKDNGQSTPMCAAVRALCAYSALRVRCVGAFVCSCECPLKNIRCSLAVSHHNKLPSLTNTLTTIHWYFAKQSDKLPQMYTLMVFKCFPAWHSNSWFTAYYPLRLPVTPP